MSDRTITLTLPEDLAQILDTIVQWSGRTEKDILFEALVSYLEDQEDIMIAEQTLAEVKAGRMRLHSWEEVMAMLKIDCSTDPLETQTDTTIEIPDDMAQRLAELSKLTGHSVNDLIVEMLTRYLDNLEKEPRKGEA